MLSATEDSSVTVSVGGNVFHHSDHTAWEQSLYSADGHGVRDGVVVDVDVLIEKLLIVVAREESLRRFVAVDTIPDNLLLAGGGKVLVLRRVQVLLMLQALNIAIVLFTRGAVGLFLSLNLNLGGINGRCKQGSCEGDLEHFFNLYYIN